MSDRTADVFQERVGGARNDPTAGDSHGDLHRNRIAEPFAEATEEAKVRVVQNWYEEFHDREQD